MKQILEYIGKVKWQFAKTMPEIPHEYTVRSWEPDLQLDFEFFVQYIRDEGYTSVFAGREYTYLNVAGYKYWTMGAPVNETTVINREPLNG